MLAVKCYCEAVRGCSKFKKIQTNRKKQSGRPSLVRYWKYSGSEMPFGVLSRATIRLNASSDRSKSKIEMLTVANITHNSVATDESSDVHSLAELDNEQYEIAEIRSDG